MELGWDCLERLAEWAALLNDPLTHFLLSAIAGFLVYSLTLTTLSVHGWVWERLTSRKVSTVAGYIMIFSSLLLASAVVLGLHYVVDTYCCAFLNPLNEPLDLILP